MNKPLIKLFNLVLLLMLLFAVTSVAAAASGSCGSKLNWSLDKKAHSPFPARVKCTTILIAAHGERI